GKLQSVFRIPVEDQKAGSVPEGKCFSKLLNGPSTRRMFGDVEVQDAPTVVGDDEEAVEYSKRNCWNREEIHCRDGFPMVAKKGEPTLGRLRISRRSFHPTGDAPFRDIKTEHENFAMDARRSPSRILGDHPEDQLPNFFRCLSSPDRLPHFGKQS